MHVHVDGSLLQALLANHSCHVVLSVRLAPVFTAFPKVHFTCAGFTAIHFTLHFTFPLSQFSHSPCNMPFFYLKCGIFLSRLKYFLHLASPGERIKMASFPTDDTTFADLTLVFGGEQRETKKVHKFVLYHKSGFFKTMLNSEFKVC